MELKKLTREILGGRSKKGIATVTFTQRGLVILSSKSLEKLKIKNNSLVDVLEGDSISDFFISRGSTYQLRKNGQGGAVFNCITLCNLVIEHTWRILPHIYSDKPPAKVSFVICDKPADDEENSHVFALIRKKT